MNTKVHCTKLRDKLIREITEKIPYTIVTGSLEHRLPTIASFCFKYIEGEALLLNLDMKELPVQAVQLALQGLWILPMF